MDKHTKRNNIIQRAAQEIKSNMVINLGIGMPTLVANEMNDHVENVFFQSENGLLGIGPYPTDAEVDPNLINAGKETVTAAKGASYFDNAESFAMIRGGHIDLAILGGMEVSETADLANYMIPGKLVKGMGGAMDLVVGAKKVVVIMDHMNKHGDSKIKAQCELPLTGVGVVNTLITDLAVFQFENSVMKLVELQPGVTLEQVEANTNARFEKSFKVGGTIVEDKVMIMTGAASGIGLGIAKVFLNKGAKVVLADLDKDKLNQEVAQLKRQGFDCIAIQVDVTEENEMAQMIEATIKHYGRLDILFNNAGLQHVSPIESFSTDKFRQMVDIMLTGSFIGTKYALPIMKEQGYGRILNMSSINGIIGFAGKAAYNSAKHGIIGLTKVAALETATEGITVNALCPGYIDTPLVRNQMEDLASHRGVSSEQVLEEVLFPLIPQKQLIDIQDVADYALFLCSDGAKSVTGQAILIDGGYTAQ